MIRAIINVGLGHQHGSDIVRCADSLKLTTARWEVVGGTLVAQVEAADGTLAFSVGALALALGRDAIAVLREGCGHGALVGPRPEAYLPFDPSRFKLFSEVAA